MHVWDITPPAQGADARTLWQAFVEAGKGQARFYRRCRAGNPLERSRGLLAASQR